MSPALPYSRDKNGARIGFHGMNTVNPPDALPPGKYPFAQNVRAYLREAVTSRAVQDSSVLTLPAAVHSLRRLNDSTPAGPVAGFILVGGASTNLYANAVQVDSGLSGNPISLVPFRPNASVQPWMYVGDSVKMDKVRSDGTRFKMGIAEPQAAPTVTAKPISPILATIGPLTLEYWFDSPHDGPVSCYIWKNASDTGGSGPVRSSTPPNGTTTGNSLQMDISPQGYPGIPMAWVTYQINNGVVNTAGTVVNWVSGNDFGNLAPGEVITINSVPFTILSVPSNILLNLTTSAGTQTSVAYTASSINGSVPIFTPNPTSDGYAFFNWAMTGNFYVPVAGTYIFNVTSHNDCMFGIGSTAQGKATWAGPAAPSGTLGVPTLSIFGQTKSALNGYPLIPLTRTNTGGGVNIDNFNVSVTFSAPGNYPFEIDYDYWKHSQRTFHIKVNGFEIAPIPNAVIVDAQYRFRYRSSATGAISNPSPASAEEVLAVAANTLTATPSTDPQVDKIDWYRLDTGLTSYTYVGTSPNSLASFSDTLLDADVIGNPQLEFDNFEPFPSIDLPRKGVVNVSAGVATWVSGDTFNVRWLPGTIIIVGTVAYVLDKRPTSSTSLTAILTEIVGGIVTTVPIASGTNLTYEIAQPILAAQPLPYLWGPTDNVSFFFGVGDPLRPGTLYWSKGNNPDSAPDTNQEDVTSPSEPLVNGCIVNGLGWVASTERAWLIYPNFFNALATVEGTVGSTWTLQESALKRGLYIPRGLAVDGAANVFFRAKDGIYISPGGQGGESITDDDLFNLFPHEGKVPKPVTRGGYTVMPPDDTKPQNQKMNVANGYLYYDYLDTTNTPQTLVFDIAARGWVLDEYQYPATLHILEEGAGVNGTLTGNVDGSVRPLVDSGPEVGCAVLLMPCENSGDTRAEKHWGDLYIEAGIVGQ